MQPPDRRVDRAAGGQGAGRRRCFDVAQALDNPFVHERDGVVDYAYPDGRAARG